VAAHVLRSVREPQQAEDLTQEFFARLLERYGVGGAQPGGGRFRSYLLGAVRHFLSDQRDRERRLKRGGGRVLESLDAPVRPDGDTRLGDGVAGSGLASEDLRFDRDWAVAVMDRALRRLEAEWQQGGRGEAFQHLKPWLAGDAGGISQAEVGRLLGMGESAVKVAVHRMRKQLRGLLREEVLPTLPPDGDPEDELRYLVAVLGR
jgi:RNA polymerase sigma-70 factor (ECF subfamily)